MRRAAGLLGLEGLALALVGAVDAVATAFGSPTDRGLSLLLAGFGVATGGLLVLLGSAVNRLRGWARTPALVLQLLAFPVGTGFVQGGLWWVAVPVLLLAGATMYHLLAAGRSFSSG